LLRNRITYEVGRTSSYESNVTSNRDRPNKTYGSQESNPLPLATILEGFNHHKGLDSYPTLPFIQPTSNRTHSTIPMLNSANSGLEYSSRPEYSGSKSGLYGSYNDNSLYYPNSQPLSLKTGGNYAVQNSMTSFYQSNQHAYNPFGSSSAYSTAACDYGSSGLSHPASNLSASRPYGYVGSSDLWNGSGTAIGYDAPGVAAAAAATGVAAAAAAAAAINYGASMNHHSSYMAGIASQYGKQNYLS